MEYFKFPKNFLWGASTSSHQVEGNNNNDWSKWEKENAKRLAEESRSYWSKWQQVKFPEMFESQNYISGKACDHYHLYEQDFKIAKELGCNATRFSIEWSRIEPKEGKFNKNEINHYKNVITTLKKLDIEPFVTIWHWPIPIWLHDKGGWRNNKIPEYFERYTERLIMAFGNNVKFWITINEPQIYASNSYLKGIWQPQKKNIFIYLHVLNNLIKAHRKAYKVIKKVNLNANVGIAKNNAYFEAYKNKVVNRALKSFVSWWWNFYFLNKIKDYQDFIGLNYYFHNRINYGFNKNENKKVSDLGWEIYPKGIYYSIKSLSKYKLPIFITENGLADKDDKSRTEFIKKHLYWTHKAIQKGIDVRGYFYWSLLDNFEWDKGFWPRFGLVEINYKTQERKIRQSAWEYAKICKNNTLVL